MVYGEVFCLEKSLKINQRVRFQIAIKSAILTQCIILPLICPKSIILPLETIYFCVIPLKKRSDKL